MATVYKNRQLVYLAIIFFFYFASIGCLAPYLTSHMRHLGFSLPEVSFINAVSAFISLIGPVLGGAIAERHAKYKSVTVFCIFASSVAFAALSFVPRSERLHYRPLVDFSCHSGIRIERCVNWATCHDALPAENLTTVRLTDCHYQCLKGTHPGSTSPLHICFRGDSGNICVVYDSNSGNNSASEFETQLSSWPFDEEKEKEETEDAPPTGPTFGEDYVEDEEDIPRAHVAMCNYHPHEPISFNQKNYHSISCRPSLEDCNIHCRASFYSKGLQILPKHCEEANGNPSTTFWSYLILRCIADLSLLTTVCLLDALTISSTSDYEGAYGRIHIWPALGIAVFAPFSGALLDHYTDMEGRADFSPPAFLAAALAIVSCALIIVLPIHSRRYLPQFQSLSLPTKGSKLLSVEMFVFLVIVIILGMQWGILFTFLPWLTMDVGCSGMMTGLGFTLIFGCSLPFLLISKNMVRNIGRANLLVFALLFYGTRYAGVSFVFSPWWTLPFASMGTFTLCVMWVAAVAYGQSLAPPGYNLVMQYILNMLHFGVGRGIGSLLGGTLISHHGQRVTFRGVAVFSACVGFLFLAVYHLALRRTRAAQKGTFPVSMNGSWYPLREQHPNGDTKAHQPIVVDQDDDIDSTSGNSPTTK